MTAGILSAGEVAERLMAALLKSAESKDFVGSNPTLSASISPVAARCVLTLGRSTPADQYLRRVLWAFLASRLDLRPAGGRRWSRVGPSTGWVRAWPPPAWRSTLLSPAAPFAAAPRLLGFDLLRGSALLDSLYDSL